MTIIQPSQNKNAFFWLSALFVVGLLALIIWWLTVYNSLVDIKHNITVLEEEIGQRELENAELKNSVYALINPTRLEELVKKNGFVKDKGAKYLESNAKKTWGFASQQ